MADDLDFGATIRGMVRGQNVFGRYTLTKILGRGGMGLVWLAHDGKLERDVALKFLPELVALDARAIDDLKRETKRALDLTHSHIVRIYDFVDDARSAAIAMEWIDGPALSALALERPDRVFTVAEMAPWVKQLCEALTYAHEKAGVVHRDLKPANLMIDRAGDLKITDFGISATLSESTTRVSKAAGTSGTPLYMSPQQLMGEKPVVSDDIYAVGATLYEMLTGKAPFFSGAIEMQVVNKVPPSMMDRRAELEVEDGGHLPAAWEATIAACLAKDPAERPQSAAEVWARLGGADTNFQPQISNVQRTKGASNATPKSKMPVMAALTVGVAGLVVAGWWFAIHAPEQRRVEVERLRAEQVRGENERLDRERLAAEQEAERQRVLAVQQLEWERINAARGGLIIRTEPIGADIAVGGVGVEKSPATFRELRLGAYEVTISKAGYEPIVSTLDVEENRFKQPPVTILAPSTGSVELTSEPAGVEYELRSMRLTASELPVVRRTGRTPASLTALPIGAYAVTFRRPDWPGRVQEVEVTRGGTATAVVEFLPGALELTSTPSGAEVWREGRQVGRTPYREHAASTGSDIFELRLQGYQPATETVTVLPRQVARGNVVMEKLNFQQLGMLFENTLGMKFVPVSGTDVLFSVWETRVQDFEAFVRDTSYAVTAGSGNASAQKARGGYALASWKNPGFTQTGLHPVVFVNYDDAVAFCRWLTAKEQREGKIGPNQEYRLPTDAEWDVAVGRDQFPWGNQWPPPRGAGNYADMTAKREGTGWSVIDGYDDGHAGTSPVGSFTPNRNGLYDMGGNVWELVDGRQNGLRGASFINGDRSSLASSYRNPAVSGSAIVGFRVVCAAELSR